MNRREFIRYSGLGMTVGFAATLGVSCNSNVISKYEDKVTVLVRVKGGMDGYHLIAPKGNDFLLKGRPNIQKAIEKEGILWKDNWHIRPNFGILSDLIQKDWLRIIPNVGYPDYNRLSHFKAQDYWETGSVVNDGKQFHNGWIGRLVDEGKIKAIDNPSPVLILDNEQTWFDKGNHSQGIYHIPNKPNSNLNPYVEDWLSEFNDSDHYRDIFKTVKIQHKINKLLNDITPNSVNAKDMVGKFNQVADCIEKGLPFSVYNVTQTGYDTHQKQSIRLEPLAINLFEGLQCLAERLSNGGNWERVKVLVYTEFGRTIAENCNYGTDHGTANHSYLLGGDLGNLWNDPDLGFSTLDIGGADYIKHKVDFRDIYKSIV
jgi:uncharacterized protein (DUF1501 family)